MGLAVLPARLKGEMEALAQAILEGRDISDDPALSKHAPWAEELKARYTFTKDNVEEILHREIGAVFTRVLEPRRRAPAAALLPQEAPFPGWPSANADTTGAWRSGTARRTPCRSR